MLDPIIYRHTYTFDNVPLQWIQGMEMFYPDLTNFPICYVHFREGQERIYGFPVGITVSNTSGTVCTITVTFLCNKDPSTDEIKDHIMKEIKGRFGLTNPLVLDDLDTCTDDTNLKNFLKEIWKTASSLFGNSYPYGKLYEEMYSIVRFVAAWAPKTGRQSEMRALYNFMSLFGEKIEVKNEWKFLDFFVIPTYQDVVENNLSEFPKFQEMFVALQKIWNEHWKLKGIYNISCDNHGSVKYPKYTRVEAEQFVADKKNTTTHKKCTYKITSNDMEIFAADNGWGYNIDEFDRNYATPWYEQGKITLKEKNILKKLVSAFNRHPGRTTYFVWSIMSIAHKPYDTYDPDYYYRFYQMAENPNFVGISPKVVGCFLQQGFEQQEMIPIDTWVESFHKGPLGIDSKYDFFKQFKKIGKLERMIWKVSQAKKTNADPLMNVLWCIRFGETGNHVIRYANPLSCYACDFHNRGCVGFEKIRNKKVLIKDEKDVEIVTITTDNNKNDGKKIITKEVIDNFTDNLCDFVCLTQNGVPKKIFKENKDRIQLVDEFSESRVTNNTILQTDMTYSVNEFITSLGPNSPPTEADIEDS